MASRPHDADEPAGGEPRNEEQGTSPEPEDVDRRWEEIVSQLRDAPDPRSWTPEPRPEEEDHFVPPDPGPVLGGDPLLTMAWVAVLGVPLLFLLSLAIRPGLPTVVLQTAGALFIAGLGVLIWRMPSRRDEDEGPGAVV
jgi:hypothetical protein